jgi:hypothetical protein
MWDKITLESVILATYLIVILTALAAAIVEDD